MYAGDIDGAVGTILLTAAELNAIIAPRYEDAGRDKRRDVVGPMIFAAVGGCDDTDGSAPIAEKHIMVV